MIAAGRVRVNGVVAKIGDRVTVDRDRVEVDGHRVEGAEALHYLVLNKPRGYVTTMDDPEGRRTVRDLVADVEARVYPVGRLDYESEGLLLLTNDGELAHRLTHPRYEVPRLYQATVKGLPSPRDVEMLERGVALEDGITAPARVRVDRGYAKQTVMEIELREGRNRQVRRMCEAVGHPVLRLVRVALGPLVLGDIPTGAWRPLTKRELHLVRKCVGLVGKKRKS